MQPESAGPRPRGVCRSYGPGEDSQDSGGRPLSRLTKGTTQSGRSILGSGIIASHRWLTQELLNKSAGTTVYVINDFLDVSSVFRSSGIPVRLIYPSDSHSRHEVLVNITEGGVMGVVVGLSGPSSTALDLNQSRSRKRKDAHPKRNRDADTRRIANDHASLSETMMTVKS